MAKATKKTTVKKAGKAKLDDVADVDIPLTPAQQAYDAHRKSLTPREQRAPTMYGQKDSPELRAVFIHWLELGVTPAKAARECGLGVRTVWDWRGKDEQFKEQWEDAVAVGIAKLEDEATRRAVDGVDRPVFQQGECVGFVREYSDDLLKFVLAARDPKRFSRAAQTGDGGSAPTSLSFTFNFGNTQVKATAGSDVEVHATVDGAVSDGSDLQPRPLLDHRSDD